MSENLLSDFLNGVDRSMVDLTMNVLLILLAIGMLITGYIYFSLSGAVAVNVVSNLQKVQAESSNASGSPTTRYGDTFVVTNETPIVTTKIFKGVRESITSPLTGVVKDYVGEGYHNIN